MHYLVLIFFRWESIFGIWFLTFKNYDWDVCSRAFFVIYYDEGSWTFQLFWINGEDVYKFFTFIKRLKKPKD